MTMTVMWMMGGDWRRQTVQQRTVMRRAGRRWRGGGGGHGHYLEMSDGIRSPQSGGHRQCGLWKTAVSLPGCLFVVFLFH